MFQRAYSTCRKYVQNGVSGGPPVPTPAQLRAAIAIAQCMGGHGFPQFPDPLADVPDQPSLTLSQVPLTASIDFSSPPAAFSQAVKACSGVQL